MTGVGQHSPSFDRLRPKLAEVRPNLPELGQKSAKFRPASADVDKLGRSCPNPAEIWPQLGQSCRMLAGVAAKFGRVRPSLAEPGQMLATFGTDRPNFGPRRRPRLDQCWTTSAKIWGQLPKTPAPRAQSFGAIFLGREALDKEPRGARWDRSRQLFREAGRATCSCNFRPTS